MLTKNKTVSLNGIGEIHLEREHFIKVNDSKISCFFSKILGKSISYGRILELIANNVNIGSICATKRSFIDPFINAKIEYFEKEGVKYIRFFNTGMPAINSNQDSEIFQNLDLINFEFE